MALDERHHTILQSLMSRGPQAEGAVKDMYKKLFDLRGNVDEKFMEFQAAYNKKLDRFQMEIRTSRNQYDGTTYYGVVNKQANEQSKLGTHLTYAQVVFFKALIEALVSDPSASGQLSSIEALNVRPESFTEEETNALSKLNLSQREKTVADLVNENWLKKTTDGFIRLGVRSFLELRSIFKNLDVPFCEVCNEAAIKAMQCQNEECPVRMHAYCAQMMFERIEPPRNCPKCKTGWDCSELVFEPKPVVKTEAGPSKKKSSSTKKKSSARKRRNS